MDSMLRIWMRRGRKGRYIDAFDVWENLVGSHDEEIFDQQAELVDIGIIVCVVG